MITLNDLNNINQNIAINATLSNGVPIKTTNVTTNNIQYLCIPNITYTQTTLELNYYYLFSLNNNMITNILHPTANIYMAYQPSKSMYSILLQNGILNENVLFSFKTMITNQTPYYSSINLHMSQYKINLNSFKTIIGQELPTGELS